MKLALQIAAGILIASFVLWTGGMIFTAAAVQAFAETLPRFKPVALKASSPQPQFTQAQYDRWNAETDAEEAREKAQKARCMVRTSDGRLLYCDPRGPFTPR